MLRLNRALLPMGALAAFSIVLSVLTPDGTAGSLSPRSEAPGMTFGKTVVINSPVRGDVEVLGGTVFVDESIEGNVIVFGGDVDLSPRAHVKGDVIAIGGRIRSASSSRVEGHIYTPGSVSAVMEIASRGGTVLLENKSRFTLLGAAVSLSLLLIWFLSAIAVTLAAGRDIRQASSELRASPFHSFTVGLLAFTSFVLTAVMFSYLVPFKIGVPLLAILGLFALFTKVYGMVAVFHAIGRQIFRARTRTELEGRRWFRGDLLMVITGLAVLGLVRMIPYVGTIAWMGASIFGTGVALATRFGRREPWFLEVRTAAPADS